MTIEQYFIPCTGGIDSHEHNVYCGCECQGLGTEVFPKRIQIKNRFVVICLDTGMELVRKPMQVIEQKEFLVGGCPFCGGAVTLFERTLKKANGELYHQRDAYGICTMCGAI